MYVGERKAGTTQVSKIRLPGSPRSAKRDEDCPLPELGPTSAGQQCLCSHTKVPLVLERKQSQVSVGLTFGHAAVLVA